MGSGQEERVRIGVLVAGFCLLGGCAVPARLLLPADPQRDGTDGTDGPLGAELIPVRATARMTEQVPVDLVVPVDASGDLAVTDAPAVIFVHGGFVAPDRYLWLAAHQASRGYVVALPRAELLLAITQPGNGEVALAALRDEAGPGGAIEGAVAEDGPVVVSGHSLGGVVAAMQWVGDPSIRGLALYASYPSKGTDVASAAGRPVIALAGSADGSAPAAAVGAHLDRFAPPLYFGVVDGLDHYGWTDDPSPSELKGDGQPGRPVPELRRDVDRVLDTWLDAWLREDGAAAARLDQPFPNVENP